MACCSLGRKKTGLTLARKTLCRTVAFVIIYPWRYRIRAVVQEERSHTDTERRPCQPAVYFKSGDSEVPSFITTGAVKVPQHGEHHCMSEPWHEGWSLIQGGPWIKQESKTVTQRRQLKRHKYWQQSERCSVLNSLKAVHIYIISVHIVEVVPKIHKVTLACIQVWWINVTCALHGSQSIRWGTTVF